jgi:hypothetical protein
MKVCAAVYLRPLMSLVLLATVLHLAPEAEAKNVKKAKSKGNDQITFTMKLEPKKFPFCNTSEAIREEKRPTEAAEIPALLAPKVCGDDNGTWDLADDPHLHAPYIRNEQWNMDQSIWQGMNAGQKDDVCLAGKADIVVERSYRYGFCSQDKYNLGDSPPFPQLKSDFSFSDADYYVLNIVVWSLNDGLYAPSSSRWYIYNHGDHGHWYRQPLPNFNGDLRIYGTNKSIGLIAIYIRPKELGSWENFSALTANYTVTVKSKTPANVSNLTSLLSIALTKSQVLEAKQKSDPDGFYGAMFLKAKAAADITISAEVKFPPKPKSTSQVIGVPAGSAPPLRSSTARLHLMTVNLTQKKPSTGGSTSNGNAGNEASGGTKDTGQGKDTTTGNNSSDQTPASPSIDCPATKGTDGSQSPCKFNAVVDDENLYHWDVGFGVPFKTVTDLQFNTTNGTSVIPKTVTRLNAYAFFDVYPIAADIKTPPVVMVPHLFAALPISGQVFNRPMFGGGSGINVKRVRFLSFIPLQIQFFGGVIYNKEFRQIPGTTGSSNVTGHRVWNGSYGLEIPVLQFKDLLSKNSKNSSTSSTGTDKTNKGGSVN